MKRRLPLMACLLALTALMNCGSPTASTQSTEQQIQLTRLPPEVRLRKLHLVRPDLIQYPISYEVYC
jgi:hypothetical protein